MAGYYKLVDRVPVPLTEAEELARMRGERDHAEWERQHRVGWTKVGETEVSTVFLDLDHSFGYGPPQHFETMTFSPDSRWQNNCWRYADWEAAEAGHARIVARLTAGLPPEEER